MPDVQFYENFITLMEKLYVPEVKRGFDEPLTESCFADYVQCRNNLLTEVLHLVSPEKVEWKDQNFVNFKRRILTCCIILHGQHSHLDLWSSNTSIELSREILEGCLRIFNHHSVEDSLSADQCALFKIILSKMRPWLLKESWKKYPAAVVCYSWVIQQLHGPDLGEHLGIALPTALIITDDYETHNKIVGLKCLTHFINEVPMTQLSWHGYDQVILKAIEPLSFFKDAELLMPFTSVFVGLLNKKYPLKNRPILQMTEFDELISRILKNMILEEKLNLRSSYMEALSGIIEARGLGMVLHSNILMTILEEYILEPTSSQLALKVLLAYIKTCWPRIEKHCVGFLVLLCKVSLGLEEERFPPGCKEPASEITSLLSKLCPEESQTFFDSLSSEKELSHLRNSLLLNV